MFTTGLGFLLFVLAAFRLTRLFVFDKITAFIRAPFHEEMEESEPDGSVVTYIQIKGTGLRYWIGELLSCYWCSGIWCSGLLIGLYYIWPEGTEVLISILAIAGAAGIIETLVGRLMNGA
ncbi:DUF1360 domain-containing protein [Oceanobacillus senegalensis]|uniref:DUF1360 domain-containing protein n=1 Tax=Oceanobacillus senegalensis TaxID=1936063 RepID=UPI000A3094ED|nr:DUF1360 domain-containing protein [Oceanobacillus senegalensis]